MWFVLRQRVGVKERVDDLGILSRDGEGVKAAGLLRKGGGRNGLSQCKILLSLLLAVSGVREGKLI